MTDATQNIRQLKIKTGVVSRCVGSIGLSLASLSMSLKSIGMDTPAGRVV